MPNADAPRPGSRALFAATIAYGVLAAVALAAFGTLPAATETGPELVAWFRSDPNSIRLGVWAFTAALPPLAVMVALLRGILPAPHRDVFFFGATIYAASEQSVETITIFGSAGFTQPGGAMNMQLGGGLTLAWILALGFWGGVRGRYSFSSQSR